MKEPPPTPRSRADAPPRLRVVHVVGGLQRGGIETWLARVVAARSTELDVHIAILEPPPWPMELAFAGHARLHYVRRSGSILAFSVRMRTFLARVGPVDVVHSHVSFLSGAVVSIAAAAGVPVRIAHSHTDARVSGKPGRMRRTYIRLMRLLIRRFASHVAGSSQESVTFMMGSPSGRGAVERVVVPLAIDGPRTGVDIPEALPKRRPMRVGHVGRFVEAKNHAMLIEIARALEARGRPFEMMLVGDGPLRTQIEASVSGSGLSDRVRFLGERDDVDVLLERCIDVFVFPSHFEGFGLAALEAQAAGLPCVIAAHLPTALSVIPELVYRVDREASADRWVDAIVIANDAERLPMHVIADRIAASPYSLERSSTLLSRLYHSRGRAWNT